MGLLSGIGWAAWLASVPVPVLTGIGLQASSHPPLQWVASAEPMADRARPANSFKTMLAPRPLTQDVFYDVNLGSASLSALLDWHPFGSGFRTTGGIMVNSRDGIGERVLPRGSYGLSPTVAVVSLRKRTLSFYEPTPYVGVGWGRSVGRTHALSLSLDVGVLVQSTTAPTQLAAGGIPGVQSSAADYLTSGDIVNLMRSLSYSPVVSMGMGLRF